MRDEVRLPDGTLTTREYVVHPGAVMVIPMLDDGRLVLERQYRYPVRQAMIEFPAGKLDAGESTQRCAQRELLEETGYTAREWAWAGVMHPVISYSTEFIEIWFARGLVAGERQLDAGEFLDVYAATPAELLDDCRTGRVTDAKTLAGALWLQNVLSGAWTLDWQPALG
ncbi:MAG: NUDIX hydrolase [Burkholderiales bacterium]|nr:NUDIX hydrolase [Burkholderiales bacterium]